MNEGVSFDFIELNIDSTSIIFSNININISLELNDVEVFTTDILFKK